MQTIAFLEPDIISQGSEQHFNFTAWKQNLWTLSFVQTATTVPHCPQCTYIGECHTTAAWAKYSENTQVQKEMPFLKFLLRGI